MTTPFSYACTYTLDKSHFEECFSESVTEELTFKSYRKAIILSLVGLSFLLFSEQDSYVAWFIIALSAIDALSLYYRKPWWVLRQLLSKAANSELTVTIDEEGIKNTSYYVNNEILWNDIFSIDKTDKGYLIHHSGGKNYLSDRVLSSDAQTFINSKHAVSND